MTKTTLSKLLCAIALTLFMASCLDDYFQDMTLENYTRNFIKEFGLVDPEQDWNMAKACDVSVNIGSEKASSVKIYGLYGGKYYLCADLKNVKGQFKVPVDVPKSTEDFIVKVDGRSYSGRLNQTIDCTGDPTVQSREATGNTLGSSLIDGTNIKLTTSTNYNPATWVHGSSDAEYKISATGYGSTTITVGATHGDLLEKDRAAAVYGPNRAYQVINAQQVAPIVSKGSWTNYYSIGKGMTSYSGDMSRGFVPEGGVPNTDDGDNNGRNNCIGNTGNKGVAQDFTFDLDGDMFTVYPMFYGTNLVHILGFYLLDDDNKPIIGADGEVMKFPIYKTKQNDDMMVRIYPESFKYISVAQASSDKKVAVSNGRTKNLTLRLWKDGNQEVIQTIDYSKVEITNPNTAYFTITKGTNCLELEGKALCTDKEVTIKYLDGETYTLKVSVTDPNVIASLMVNDLVADDTNKGYLNRLDIELGTPFALDISFLNSSGDVCQLSTVDYNTAIDNIRWNEGDYANYWGQKFDVYRDNHTIYIKGKDTGEAWVNLWIEGLGSKGNNDVGVHAFVTDPYSQIQLGIVNGTQLVGNDGITLQKDGSAVTLKLMDVTDWNNNSVQALPTGASSKITHTTATKCTISSIGSDGTFTVTPGSTGGEETITFTLGSKSVTLKVNVADPNALKELKFYNGTTPATEISAITANVGDADPSYFYVKRVAANDVETDLSNEEWTALEVTAPSSGCCTVAKGELGEIVVTPVSEGTGNITVSVGGKSGTVSATISDPNKLSSIVVLKDNAQVTGIDLTLNQSATVTVKGIKQSDNSQRDLTDAEWSALTVTFSTSGVCSYTKGSVGSLTVTGSSEGATNMTVSTGSFSATAIPITVTDPNKLKSITIVNTDGTEIKTKHYLEPYEGAEEVRVKVVGTNMSDKVVDLNEDQLKDLEFICKNDWSENLDQFATLDPSYNGELVIQSVESQSSTLRLQVKYGSLESNIIDIIMDFAPIRKVNSITINNANVSGDWTNYNNNFVVDKGSSIAVDITYTGAKGEVDKHYGIMQVELMSYPSSYCTVTKNGDYFVVTGTSVTTDLDADRSVKFKVGYNEPSFNVIVTNPADNRPQSQNPSGYTNPAPKHHKATAAKKTSTNKSSVKKSNKVTGPVIKTKPLVLSATASDKGTVKFERRKSRTVRYISAKEQKQVAKRRAAQRKKDEQKYAAQARSRAGEEVPAKFQYESEHDATKWGSINKVWTQATDVNSFQYDQEQMVLVKGFDVTIDGKIPHKRVGLYIDVLDNPDISDKRDCYYTGMYRNEFDNYPDNNQIAAGQHCPFPYTHFSQKGLNIYVTDARDAEHTKNNANPLVKDDTKFEFSYGAAYKHPISGRMFFSFEDWRVKHPSPLDSAVTSTKQKPLIGYEYENKDFWGITNASEKYTGDYSSDRDLNDLVFVMYGASKVNGTTTITTTTDVPISWLWAVEDLGATDDFDFNDLVMRITSVTENINVEETDGGATGSLNPGEEKIDLKFYKKVTFQPLCAGGTLPLYVHYSPNTKTKKDYTLKPGVYVGEHISTFYDQQDRLGATVTRPYDRYEAQPLDNLINAAESETEIHKWFGNGYGYTSMINTGKGPNVSERDIKSCVMYICDEDYVGFTAADFATGTSIADITQSSNKAGLYVNVKDDRGDNQYEDGTPIYDPATEVGTGWSVTPPSEPGKVSQMFMIPDDGWRWPKERCHILDAYPAFKTWVNSTKNGDDWYNYNKLTSDQKANCY